LAIKRLLLVAINLEALGALLFTLEILLLEKVGVKLGVLLKPLLEGGRLALVGGLDEIGDGCPFIHWD
jgi:hypothetical protein